MSDRPKVAVIVGSLRAKSVNRRLADAIAKTVAGKLDLQIVDYADVPLYNQDHEADPPAAVIAFKDTIKAADAVLFVTPEYNRSMPGVLKNAIDWASRGTRESPPPLTGQIACIFGASPGMTGSARAQDQLRLILRRTVTQVAPIGEILVFQAHTKIIDGQLADERTREALRKHLAGFADAVRQWRA